MYQILDATFNPKLEIYLYRCLAPMPYRQYRKRREYLDKAIPNGLRKKILFHEGKAVGQIEYAPVDFSAYPVKDGNIIVLNCI